MNAILRTERQDGDHEMAIMGREGDTKQMWNPQNTFEVEQAEKQFKEFRAKGYLAFRVNEAGDKGEQMREFDPTAAKIIFSPQMQGG